VQIGHQRFTCYEMSCQSRDCRGSFDGPMDEELTARRGETAPILESCRRRGIRFLPIDSVCSGPIRNVFLMKLDIYSADRWCIKAKRERPKAFIKDLYFKGGIVHSGRVFRVRKKSKATGTRHVAVANFQENAERLPSLMATVVVLRSASSARACTSC
jgi:hypothetical protein